MWVVFCYSSTGSQYLAGVYASKELALDARDELKPKWQGVDVLTLNIWEPVRPVHVDQG
jgi:hypothetical protein